MTNVWTAMNKEVCRTREKSGVSHSVPEHELTFDGAPVDVLVLWFLQRRVLVEQIGNKGQVQFGVAADDVRWHDELSASEPVGLVQHALGPLHVLCLLQTRIIF